MTKKQNPAYSWVLAEQACAVAGNRIGEALDRMASAMSVLAVETQSEKAKRCSLAFIADLKKISRDLNGCAKKLDSLEGFAIAIRLNLIGKQNPAQAQQEG